MNSRKVGRPPPADADRAQHGRATSYPARRALVGEQSVSDDRAWRQFAGIPHSIWKPFFLKCFGPARLRWDEHDEASAAPAWIQQIVDRSVLVGGQ